MKIFIYKTLIVAFFTYLIFQVTVGMKLNQYEKDLKNSIHDKNKREQVIEKIKDEIKSANKKDNLFTSEEKELLSTFINKIVNELNLGN